MRINDLPQGTPTPSDVVPFSTNDLDYKATMEDITELVEVSEKSVTFTSDDEETPTAYKTMATLASGALNTLMGILSKAVSNVRFLYSKLTELTTQVNDNTDSINTLNSKLPLCGFVSWSDVSVPNGSFITNTGNTGTGVTPLGNSVSGVYNMGDIARGRWLCIFHARFKEGTNTTGLRGLRVYVNEVSTGDETFIAPAGNGTDMRTFYILNNNSNSNASVRMGLYQGSGSAVTATAIWIVAIKIGNL